MDVICLEDKAYYSLLEHVMKLVREKYSVPLDRWISDEEAMKMLRITAKSTLAKFRNEGKIRYSQPERKIILYDRLSILKYLESHAKETY